MGFGGLFRFACHELRYELCGWLISYYDVAYHQLNMATNIVVHVNEEQVSTVMGIPSNGIDMVMHNRRATSNHTYNLSLLEQNLDNLPISDEFLKSF